MPLHSKCGREMVLSDDKLDIWRCISCAELVNHLEVCAEGWYGKAPRLCSPDDPRLIQELKAWKTSPMPNPMADQLRRFLGVK